MKSRFLKICLYLKLIKFVVQITGSKNHIKTKILDDSILKPINRREFVQSSTLATAGFAIVPAFAVSSLGHTAPSDKLNVAGVGIAGMGRGNLANVAKTENIVALCDVDWGEASSKVFKTYPKAKHLNDFRFMLGT